MELGDFTAYPTLARAVMAGLLAGSGCAVAGVFVVTMRLSFLGVCIAHAAFAGALAALYAGLPAMAGAMLFSVAAAALVGPLADRGELSPDTSIGILFSFLVGLAFLLLGLMPGSRTEALALFWGSILTVNNGDLISLAVVTASVLALTLLFQRRIHAVVCHRRTALAVGIPATVVYYGMLVSLGAVMAVSLPAVGGLLIYSLVVNPAAAALQLTHRFRVLLVLSAFFGVLSCWAGLAASWLWNLPAGASIVIASTIVFGLCALASPKRRDKSCTASAPARG